MREKVVYITGERVRFSTNDVGQLFTHVKKYLYLSIVSICLYVFISVSIHNFTFILYIYIYIYYIYIMIGHLPHTTHKNQLQVYERLL